MLPSALITLWHGTMIAMRLSPFARPTALAAPGRSSRIAMESYDVVDPNGI
jgi:hypothetical protein